VALASGLGRGDGDVVILSGGGVVSAVDLG